MREPELAGRKTVTVQNLNPYLHFDGNADKAIRHYEATLGAKVENLMRYGDVAAMGATGDAAKRVMHSELRIGGGVVMVGDAMPGKPTTVGSNVDVVLHFEDEAEMTEKFAALATGGQITMPLEDTFWGARFGALTDSFGIHWMFNCPKKG